MNIYFAPALAGLAFKLFALVLSAKRGKASTVFLSLIFVFACHNIIELIGYIQFLNDEATGILFRPYYVATIYLFLCMLLHGLNISQVSNSYITIGLIISATTLSIFVLFTNYIVAGYYSIDYALTAIQGQYYWIFTLYLLVMLFSNVAALLHSYKNAITQLNSIRCAYSLLAIMPIMIVALLVITLKATDIDINAAAIAPIATSLFLFIALKSESQHKLSDIRRLLPFSLERKTSNQFMHLADGYVNSENCRYAYKHFLEGIEREVIFYSLKKCNNNISKTSKMMGLENRSTLYSMMDRLGIDIQQLKKEKTTN